MNRGVEIAAEVADRPGSVIIDQVRNGVAVRMAVLFLLLGSGTEWGAADSGKREAERRRGAVDRRVSEVAMSTATDVDHG
jgi:hypothetical protein